MRIESFQGKSVLITGASSGIGPELAKLFAEDGAEIILVARREKWLTLLAEQLYSRFGTRVEFLPADLSLPDTPFDIYKILGDKKIPVDVLVNNAGFGMYGPFENCDVKRTIELFAVNMESLVMLTRAFLPQMIEKGKGAILNVASTAGFQPLPMQSIYGASKAFVLSFSEALHHEVRAKGVTVTCLCPGPTETEFFQAAGYPERVRFLRKKPMHPSEAAKVGFEALKKGKMTVIPGPLNRFLAFSVRFAPRTLAAAIAKKISQ
jgi:hypothetical protein